MFFTDRKKCSFSVNIFSNCFAFKENHVKIKNTRCIHTFFCGIIEIFNCLLRRVDSIPSCFFLLLKSNKSPFQIFSFMQGLFWLSKVRDLGSWPPSPPLKPPVGKTMKNLTNRTDITLVSNKKDYLKWTSKPSYISQKIYMDLIAIRESKITLKLNRQVYVGMCILYLSKVLLYDLHYCYLKNRNGTNRILLFTYTNSLICEIKTEDVCKILVKIKEMFDFKCYSAKSKYYDDSSKYVVGKMKHETGDVATESFVELIPNMHFFLVGDSSKKCCCTNRFQ